jgi:predicted nucleotidyltransferase
MFTVASRDQVKQQLIARARQDHRVAAAALLGSSAAGAEDEWSDIDLALSIQEGDLTATIEQWTMFMYEEHRAVHHLDVKWKTTLYRVFLLASTLQIDLSFWNTDEFVAAGPRFHLLFGDPPAQHTPPEQPADAIIGEAWLHLLHARSAIARGRCWQANYMIAGARDRVLALACRRHGTRPDHARGADELPVALLHDYSAMVPVDLHEPALLEALGAAATRLASETRYADPELASRTKDPIELLGSLPSASSI